MTFTRATDVQLVIPRDAIKAVLDECDRYDADETGGRLLGTFVEDEGVLRITVNGVIEPGPKTERSAVYLMQDGTYQERVFREIERKDPSVEHLGNWHTHHMNGLRHLSDGDLATYRRTVAHPMHNTDFFYALLITEKKHREEGLDRYVFKNYLFRRGDPKVYEIPSSAMTLTDGALVWPAPPETIKRPSGARERDDEAMRRNKAYDGDAIATFFPKVKAFKSGELGIYWRGMITLVDGSDVGVVVLEDDTDGTPVFTVTLRDVPEALVASEKTLGKETFPSCRTALIATERLCNADLFNGRNRKRGRRWMF